MDYIYLVTDDWNGTVAYCTSLEKAQDFAMSFYDIENIEELDEWCTIYKEKTNSPL